MEIIKVWALAGNLLNKNNFFECKEIKKSNKIGKNPKDLNEKRSALLILMSQSDSYYEQYTLYPMHKKKSKSTDTDLYQMVKVQEMPLDHCAKDLDLICSPC